MARGILLSLMGLVVLLSLSQASFSYSPKLSTEATRSHRDTWEELDMFRDLHDGLDIVDETDVETADEIDDDNKIEDELTDEKKETGSHVDFPLDKMDEDEVKLYLNLEDNIFLNEADKHVAFKLLADKQSLYSKGENHQPRKRIPPLDRRPAFGVARAMFRRFSPIAITRSGPRLTRHYAGRGSYQNAVQDQPPEAPERRTHC